MKKKEERKVRTYKATESDYQKAMKAAKKKNTSLASEMEKFIQQYDLLYDYISR